MSKRILLTVSDEVYDRLGKYSELIGVPRATLCALWVGQTMLTMDTTIHSAHEAISTIPSLQTSQLLNNQEKMQNIFKNDKVKGLIDS